MEECTLPILYSFYEHDCLPADNKMPFNFIHFTVSSSPPQISYMNGLKIIYRYYKATERM
jgi:hypothetical protein